MKNISLVLEGGGMRGIYTAGVLDLFLDKNIDINYCIGVSAGACHGTSYISKQYKRNYRVNINYIRDKRYIGVGNLIKTGSLFGMDMLFNKIPNELEPFDYRGFRESNKIFIVGVTNCHTGLPEYYRINDFEEGYDMLRASISLPLISPIVEYKDKKLLDGGIASPIPIKKAIEDGNEKHIIVLTQHRGYKKEKASTIPLIKCKYRKYPKLVEAMKKRHEVYNEVLTLVDRLEQEGKCLVVRPSNPLGIGRLERSPDKLKEVYGRGYEDAKRMYKQILEFIG